MELRGKKVLITGAANGIGKAVAIGFLREGAHVIATDIDESRTREGLAPHAGQGKLETRKLDVSSWEAWKGVFGEIDRLDYLLNIAGIIEPGFIHEIPVEKIERQIDINLKGTIYGCRLAAQMMKSEGSGHIINIASMAGIAPIKGINIYSASKFGVRGFSLAIAQELKEFGVYVTVVCPDAVQTNMLDYQKDFEEAAMTFSANRYLSPEDVSTAILKDVVNKKMPELWIPKTRGTLALLGSTFPFLADMLSGSLIKKGRKRQEAYRKKK